MGDSDGASMDLRVGLGGFLFLGICGRIGAGIASLASSWLWFDPVVGR